MGYALRHDEFSVRESSYSIARRAEQNYRDMINAKLIDTLERMSKDDYKTSPMPDNYHQAVLKRVLDNLGKDDV